MTTPAGFPLAPSRAPSGSRTWALLLAVLALAACVLPAGAAARIDEAARARAHEVLARARAEARTVTGGARACALSAAAKVAAIPGFAAEAGTTGGLGGPTLTVTSDADYGRGSPPIAGSLRAVVAEAARRRGPTTIVFDPALTGRIISLQAAIRPPDDTTLDGGCTGVTLIAPAEIPLIMLPGRRNVVVAGLTLRKYPYEGENKGRADGRDFRDCITVTGAFDRLAVIHNDFETCGDGEIDITSGVGRPMPPAGIGRITVAYNRFGRHDKAMLFGTDGCGGAPAAGGGCPNYADPAARPLEPLYRMTLAGNFFEWAGQRQPRAFGRVLLHEVDNLFAFEPYDRGDGSAGATYATFASDGALVLAESNLFLGVPAAGRRPMGLSTTTTPGASVPRNEREAAIRAEGNFAVADEVVDQNRPHLVPAVRYGGARPIAPLDLRALGARTAMACIIARAGPAGTADWPAGTCRR